MDIYKRYFHKYRLLFTTAVCCVFLEALCDLMQPTIMAHIIDEGVKNGQIHVVIKYGLLMLGITCLGACFAISRSILASKVSQSFGADLRSDMFEKILRLSEVSMDKLESGSLITRMTNDTSQIVLFVNGMMRIFFKAPVTGLGSIILAVLLSFRLSINLLLVVVTVFVIIVISMKMSYKKFARVQSSIDRVNTVVMEYLMGIRLVKAFGRHGYEEEKFNDANSELFKRTVDSQLIIALSSPLLYLTVSIGIASTIYSGSILFRHGQIEVGKVAAFVNYMTQILTSIIMVTNVFNIFVRTKASTERINQVFEGSEDFAGHESKAMGGKDSLEFKNVKFAYPNGSGIHLFKDLSFKVNSGETLAVIGPTGSGKSTMAWLLLNFYQVDGGSILLNNTDIKSIDINSLRDAISLAPQKSMLFTGTILDNIAYGKESLSIEEATAAARAAQAHDFIMEMPRQYKSMLGQGGVNLSGGQRQRISIARALSKNSRFLILDDCTSALDSITEKKVIQSIKLNSSDKTVIIITQRIGTAMNADKILVLDNGVNVGFGTHNELIHSCRTYREIYDSQIGGFAK